MAVSDGLINKNLVKDAWKNNETRLNAKNLNAVQNQIVENKESIEKEIQDRELQIKNVTGEENPPTNGYRNSNKALRDALDNLDAAEKRNFKYITGSEDYPENFNEQYPNSNTKISQGLSDVKKALTGDDTSPFKLGGDNRTVKFKGTLEAKTLKADNIQVTGPQGTQANDVVKYATLDPLSTQVDTNKGDIQNVATQLSSKVDIQDVLFIKGGTAEEAENQTYDYISERIGFLTTMISSGTLSADEVNTLAAERASLLTRLENFDRPVPVFAVAMDINGDDEVDNKDMGLLELYLFNRGDNVQINEESGDLNNDGKIDVADLVLLLRYLNGDPNIVPLSPGN